MSDKEFYNKYWKERGKSKGLRLRYKIFLNWLEADSKVLDLGGGDGHLAEILQNEKNAQVTVFDLAEEALKIAQERGLKTVKGSIEEQLPFENSSFDIVILSEVIEHIVHSEEVLKEALRISKKYIFISVPNTGFIKYRFQLLFGKFPKQWVISPHEHLRFWTYRGFKKMLSKLDLDIVEVKASAGKRYIRDFWPSLFAEQLCFKLKKK